LDVDVTGHGPRGALRPNRDYDQSKGVDHAMREIFGKRGRHSSKELAARERKAAERIDEVMRQRLARGEQAFAEEIERRRQSRRHAS
jgi:hypothetical protein